MIIQPPSPPYRGPAKWHGADNNKPITRIVIHATVGAEPGVKGAAESTIRGSKATTRPSSYHYVADAETSLQYVYDSVVAYGAPPNEHSIHYELCCSLSNEGKDHWSKPDHQAMMKIVAEDVARLCLAYDVPIVKLTVADLLAGKHGICGHIDVSNAWHETTHWDPGPYFPWPDFIAKVKAAAAKLQEKPDPVPNGRRVRLGTFNVERGRPKNVAVGDVMRLWDKHELDGLALQEAEGYFNEFRGLRDSNGNRLTLFADAENPENSILLRDGRGSDFLSADYGDGWTRAGGAHRGPGVFPRVTIDGWCRFASIHYPPSTTWPGGVLHTPDARRDDVVDIAEKAQAFLGRDNLTRVIGGDMNEPPETDGKWSPGWVAKQVGAKYGAPKSREGHGRIDWAMVVRGHFEGMQKDLEIREGSDHEPVVFEVVES